jgi:hypothetical protein
MGVNDPKTERSFDEPYDQETDPANATPGGAPVTNSPSEADAAGAQADRGEAASDADRLNQL